MALTWKTTLPIVLLCIVNLVSGLCPPVSGSFFIEKQNLYPESADFDPVNCKLFLSSEYNGSVVVWDLISQSTRNIDLPSITSPGNTTSVEYHVNGIDYDASSGHIFVAASDATAFTSIISQGDGVINTNYSHANYTGTNRIVILDALTEEIVANVDLTPTQNEFHNRTGKFTSGVQDMAEVQATGDSYAIGTFGNSIFKIANGSDSSSLWYAPEHPNVTYGFGGIVAIGSKLVISDTISGGLITFDTNDQTPNATYVPLQGLPDTYRPPNADGLIAPAKYNGEIVLWSDDYNGTSVYASHDNFSTARYLGLVPKDDTAAFYTDTVEIGDHIFALAQFFQFVLPVRPKRYWPLYDITEQVEALVEKSLGEAEV